MQHVVNITDTTLRDAHQSLWATRMRTEEMLPIAEKLDNIGYHSIEMWGGATFDVCLRYLNEDPWERLRALKKVIKKTPLQMLLRGQSLVGYQHYSDDIVEAFVNKSVENGIDIIRIFDALNDIRNLEVPIKSAKKAGAHVQAAVVFTISPVHTMDHYLQTAMKLEELGADSICIKDMAGLLSPYKAFDLIKLLKENLDIPIQLHSHYVGGMAVGAYLKAAEAGVNVIDTASVPLAFGASQPPVETVVRALQESPYHTDLNLHELFDIAKYFEELRKTGGYQRGVTRITDMRVFEHQVPGGMISNFVSQLEEQKASHRIHEVMEEIPRVREDLGFPPLVTPTSQIVGNQAVLNVLAGERYKLVPMEIKAYLQGYYGKPPAAVNQELIKKVIGDRELINCRPADLLENKLDKLREEIKDLATSEEDVISYALFPQVAKKFLIDRQSGFKNTSADKNNKDSKADSKLVSGLKEDKKVNLKEIKELIKMLDETEITELNLESEGVKVSIKKGAVINAPVSFEPVTPASPAKETTRAAEAPVVIEEKKVNENLIPIVAPMVGTFYSSPAPDAAAYVAVGDAVKQGQAVCIVEAMKLMNEIESEVSGKVVEILVENGQPVEYGQTLFLVEKN